MRMRAEVLTNLCIIHAHARIRIVIVEQVIYDIVIILSGAGSHARTRLRLSHMTFQTFPDPAHNNLYMYIYDV